MAREKVDNKLNNSQPLIIPKTVVSKRDMALLELGVPLED